MLLKVNETTWVNPQRCEALLMILEMIPMERAPATLPRRLWIESVARPGIPIEVDPECQQEFIDIMQKHLADRARRQEG